MKLDFLKYEIEAADLGQENCLADIHLNEYIRAPITLTERISAEERGHVGKGMIETLLPYCIQDGYNRKLKLRGFDAAILENEYLKAVFIPELGGRLWSLYDKVEGRELLYKNSVFQPANLALRNAWFSGGIEWNVGIKGHNPLTCSPIFAARAKNKKGEPVLRMYEFERIRGVVYIIDATLEGKCLVVNITIENTEKKDKYMYWWTNIAVKETPGTRVLAPTNKAFRCYYSDGAYLLDTAEIPYIDGVDVSYSGNSERSRDYFFNIPDENKKWVASLDEDGKGLLEISDEKLIGRKMFVWGTHQGGRHWNEWLAGDRDEAYIEIQAGLLKTQLGHFIMKGESKITFTECFSALSCDSKTAHGEYNKAVDSVSEIVADRIKVLGADKFDGVVAETPTYYGSGWGALENKTRDIPISRICEFPLDSMGEKEKEGLSLIDSGNLPARAINEPVPSYIKGRYWIELLEKCKSHNWYSLSQMGVLYYIDGDIQSAENSFYRSIELEPNAFAYRNLAQIEKNIRHNFEKAANYMLTAISLLNTYIPLLIECAYALMKAEMYDKWIECYNTLSDDIKQNGRLKMLLGACYAKVGALDEAIKYINGSLVVDDLKEGEYAISSIWLEIYKAVLAKERGVESALITDEEVFSEYPLPRELDFRMH